MLFLGEKPLLGELLIFLFALLLLLGNFVLVGLDAHLLRLRLVLPEEAHWVVQRVEPILLAVLLVAYVLDARTQRLQVPLVLSVLEIALLSGLVLGKFVSEVHEGLGREVVDLCVDHLTPSESLPLLLPLLRTQDVGHWL